MKLVQGYTHDTFEMFIFGKTNAPSMNKSEEYSGIRVPPETMKMVKDILKADGSYKSNAGVAKQAIRDLYEKVVLKKNYMALLKRVEFLESEIKKEEDKTSQ